VEISRDAQDRPIEFGRGAWSIVYKARSKPCTSSLLAPSTPPSSPIVIGRVLAVKAPLRRDARPVLQAEALTLTHLNLTTGYERHVVPFHGCLAESESLVLSAIPLALSTFIEDTADLARKKQTTATMFDPVQGPDAWRDLARKLIRGLIWLHDTAGIVHGDIKPHNILLRPSASDSEFDNDEPFPYDPLFADFSSAVDLPTDGAPLPNDTTSRAAIAAFTPPFTAPELLSLASLTSGDVAPTPASDVFSLAATLLAAATGDLLLYPGSSNLQRLAMAREGQQIIEFARSGTNGYRVPRKGLVERILQPAVCKDMTQRITPPEWLVLAST
jgi:serine/threonine protein kinase